MLKLTSILHLKSFLMKKSKKFDCVEMKRRGTERIYEQTKDMTLAEELTYWQEATEKLRQRQQMLRSQKKVS